ncbi:MAG TPA: MFS transporter [Candidatus Corynebacterium gallistercoris]|uniref:MFS transporter n=1 Tax=Candidatus Corynebacterium gallistercoris TaxID=2838530 RepID=A0A9D1RWV3_9CORY|nr:MFS transporter [Candidatus Corynebacterium gallistercoris]
MSAVASSTAPNAKATNAKAAVPILLFTFVFCLIIDNGFKTMTGPMAEGLNIDPNVASLQASLAGIIIGVGAVVYAALADAISIRKLTLMGIGLVVVGSLMGFLFSGSWPMVLTGRLIQTAGLAAAETLYVIYVTKHLPAEDQKTYLGFSTAAFQAGLLVGALTSGAISTFVSWTAMFLVPLVLVLAVPFVLKYVPEDEAVSSSLDVVGLLLVTIFSTSLIMFMQDFKWYWVVFGVLGIIAFAAYVAKGRKPLVRPEFFTNGRYVWALVLVLIVYSTQLGYIVMIPFAAKYFHGLNQSDASLLMVPGYICAVLVGVYSGKIGKFLSSRTTIFSALSLIIGALVFGALTIQMSVIAQVISIVAFASGFALLYAPLVNTALSNILPEKSGIAIGFYNLTINIGIPLGIAYTFQFMDLLPSYNAVLWTLAAIGLAGAAVYFFADRWMLKNESTTQGVTHDRVG